MMSTLPETVLRHKGFRAYVSTKSGTAGCYAVYNGRSAREYSICLATEGCNCGFIARHICCARNASSSYPCAPVASDFRMGTSRATTDTKGGQRVVPVCRQLFRKSPRNEALHSNRGGNDLAPRRGRHVRQTRDHSIA